jgi:hypothetical protein
MVRRGSTVRVRQRASRKVLEMPFLVVWIGNALAAAGTKRVQEFSE